MRTFDDSLGARWQAALLDASYGNILLVFSPLHGGEVRKQMMDAENMLEAAAQLAAMDDAGLREMLADADPWEA